ncbi:UNVERIFIED_CONTAM: hypothetical protein NCL1_08023 [Trichonephila clavipes]
MDDPVCYELRVISIATGTSVKCYSPKSFPSFKTSLELSSRRIMHSHMLQRLFETCVQPNSYNIFLGFLIRRICRLLSTCGIWLVGISPVIRVVQLQKTNFCLLIQAIWNYSPQVDIQNLFESLPRHMAALIEARGGYTKYRFRTLNIVF